MSLKFVTTGDYGELSSQDWVDGATSFSFACWARMDTLQAADQWVFDFYGSNGYFGLLKHSSDVWRAIAYTNGYWRYVSGGTPAAGTIIHIAGSWEPGDANGWTLWLNGSSTATASTANQTTLTLTSPTLWLNCRSYDNSYGYMSMENLVLAKNTLWTTQDIEYLYNGIPPSYWLPASTDFAHYEFLGTLTRAPDKSGNRRHFESADLHDATDGGLIGKYEDPDVEDFGQGGFVDQAGAAPPAEWTEFGTGVDHPTTSVVVTGLTNGTTYDFRVTAEDIFGNVSVPSLTDSATPGSLYQHVPRPIFFVGSKKLAEPERQTRLDFCGFESGSAEEVKRLLGSAEVQTTKVRTGRYAARFYPTTTETGYCMMMATDDYGFADEVYDSPVMYNRAYINPTSLPTATEQILRIEDASTDLKAELRLSGTGLVSLYDSTATLVATGTTPFALNTWYRIELMTGKGTAADYELRINGETELSGTMNARATNHAYVIWGKYDNRASGTYDIAIDDIAIDRYTWCGQTGVYALLANANGSTADWSGTTPLYRQVDDEPLHDGDSTYIYSLTTDQVYLAKFQTLSGAGISGNIYGIKPMGFARKDTSSTTPRINFRTVSGDTTWTGTNSSLSQSVYYGWVHFMPVIPDTGQPWTEYDVSLVEAGFKLGVGGYNLRATQLINMVEVDRLDSEVGPQVDPTRYIYFHDLTPGMLDSSDWYVRSLAYQTRCVSSLDNRLNVLRADFDITTLTDVHTATGGYCKAEANLVDVHRIPENAEFYAAWRTWENYQWITANPWHKQHIFDFYPTDDPGGPASLSVIYRNSSVDADNPYHAIYGAWDAEPIIHYYAFVSSPPKSQWVEWKIEAKLVPDTSGYVKVWRNDVLVVDRSSTPTGYSSRHSPKFGVYIPALSEEDYQTYLSDFPSDYTCTVAAVDIRVGLQSEFAGWDDFLTGW